MYFSDWLSNNYIEIFGAVTGILFVFLEVRQNLLLWPVGIITSAVYIWVFFSGKLYADMSLQGYYLVISVFGWYWWMRGKNGRESETGTLRVTRINLKTALTLSAIFLFLIGAMWLILDKLTDSPVPGWDSFITSLSIIATWMLARKLYEHWYLWLIINITAAILFLSRGLYPTVILYLVYTVMSFIGIFVWKRTLSINIHDVG
jgi:nicotinamide mononucleotide transporter